MNTETEHEPVPVQSAPFAATSVRFSTAVCWFLVVGAVTLYVIWLVFNWRENVDHAINWINSRVVGPTMEDAREVAKVVRKIFDSFR